MRHYLHLIIGLGFIYAYGTLVLLLLNYDYRDMRKRPYLIFCFGSGSIATCMFFMGLLKIPLSLIANIAVCAILFLCVIYKKFSVTNKKSPWALYDGWPVKSSKRIRDLGFFKKLICTVFIVIIVVNVFYVIVSSLLEPEMNWDALALKAKILYLEKNIYMDYFRNPLFCQSHPYYPLLVPLETANIYFFLGDVNDSLVKGLFCVYFIMLIIAFYDLIRRYLAVPKALFFTVLLATIPGFLRGPGSANACMADTPLAFYLFISVILFLIYLRQETAHIVVTALILFFCAFTKLEGLYYSLFLILSLAVTAVMKSIFSYLAKLSTAFILLCLPWLIFKAYFIALKHANFPYSISPDYVLQRIHRLFFIIPSIIAECFRIDYWHITWVLFVSSLLYIVIIKYRRKDMFFLSFVIGISFVFFAIVYMLSSWWGMLHDDACRKLINFTVSRLLLHLAPLALLFSALSFCALDESKV